MKRKSSKIVLPAVLCAALLAGCARGAAAPDPAAVPPSETETPAATAAPQPTAQPTMAPEPSPKPAETAVYAPGAVMLKDEGLFETPPGLDADEFHTFAYYLTIALPDPVETIGEADSKAAFRLSRCMLDCFYGIYPDACSEVVYLEQDGMIRNYNVIPADDFVAFTAAHLGIGDLALHESARLIIEQDAAHIKNNIADHLLHSSNPNCAPSHVRHKPSHGAVSAWAKPVSALHSERPCGPC